MYTNSVTGFTWCSFSGVRVGQFSRPSTERLCTKRRYSQKRVRRSARCAATESENQNRSGSASELVDKLLERVTIYDGGPSTTASERAETDDLVNRLSSLGEQLGSSYLTDRRLVGNYVVSYSSSKTGYAPAGGRFVTRLGRSIFVGRGSFQHIIAADVAVNMVAFRLLGLIPGVVGLYGKIIPDSSMGKNGVMIRFDQPRIRLGPLVFQFSNSSKVRLRITYLDDRVRVGVGSRGSLFVFTKGGLADKPVADEWKHLFNDRVTVLPGVILPVAIAIALFSFAAMLFVFLSQGTSKPPPITSV